MDFSVNTTAAGIAGQTQRALERDRILRAFSRYCRDAAMFADRNQLHDADLAFAKAARLAGFTQEVE